MTWEERFGVGSRFSVGGESRAVERGSRSIHATSRSDEPEPLREGLGGIRARREDSLGAKEYVRVCEGDASPLWIGSLKMGASSRVGADTDMATGGCCEGGGTSEREGDGIGRGVTCGATAADALPERLRYCWTRSWNWAVGVRGAGADSFERSSAERDQPRRDIERRSPIPSCGPLDMSIDACGRADRSRTDLGKDVNP